TVDSAVKYFGLAVKFLDGNRAMEARRNLCRVLQLASRWDDLKKEAARALNVVTDNAHRADFLLHLARAYIAEEEYEKAADVCEEIVKINAQSTQVLPALLMLSHAVRKQTGYSRDYFLVMRNIIEKFNRSESMPAALYLLGKAYYQRGDYHRAYSAFRELKTRFPRSPEASLAAEKISAIEKHNPKIVAFVPDDAFLQTLDKIDLSFDNLDEEALVKKKSFYAVMLGPVEEKREAMRIAREIKNEFTPVKIVHSAGGYAVYVGKHAMLANATVMKIRLAEEMGYNGKVVRFRIDRNKTYIYGE
ncbi:MAG: tetratricopeptide repeat protein, partial [Spirochaetes bacterium]|nr:tetratricopeptide repeat protein [Spirochaetota bacterium]